MKEQLNDKKNLEITKEPNEEEEKPSRKNIIIIFSIGLIIFILLIIFLFSLRNRIKELAKTENILRPYIDNKEYLIIELANKMKVALISDNTTMSSGCGLSITTGSFYDIIEGLAVFASNMILAGRKDFLQDNETYIDKIIESEGKSLITTSNNMTTYSFHVHNDNFIEIIQLFSQIIDSPELTKTNEKEINVIEIYIKSLVQIQQNDFLASNHSTYLLKQIIKDLSNEYHPYHNLNIGNNVTLNIKNKDKNKKYTEFLLGDVKSYFDTFYKTKNMTLIVYSNLTIDNMTNLVKKYFGFDSHSSLDVESFLFKSKLENLTKEPYDNNNSLNKFVIYTSSNWNSLYFSFYIKNNDYLDIKIFIEYFKFVFFSRAENTLFRHLFMGDLIHKITIDESDIGYKNFNIFSFRIHIHRLKLKDHYIEIIEDVFNYIKNILNNGIKKELYDNLAKIHDFKFLTTEYTKEIYTVTSSLSYNLFSDNYNYFLKGMKFPDYNETIEKGLKDYTEQLKYENSIIVMASYEDFIETLNKDLKNNGNLEYYNYPYKYNDNIEDFLNSEKKKNKLKNNQIYQIRPINNYIPNITKNDLVKETKSEYELNDNLNLTLLDNKKDFYSFFASCTKLKLPKIEIILSFYTPYINPKNEDEKEYQIPALTMSYIINNILKQYFDEYFETGNKFYIKNNTDSFYLKILLFKNHTENIRIIKEIMSQIFIHSIDNCITRIARSDFRQIYIDYYNQTGIQSISQTHIQFLKAIVSDNFNPGHELLPKLFFNFTEDFYSKIIQSIKLNVTMIGYINKSESNDFSNTIYDYFKINHTQVDNPRNVTIKNVSNGQIYYYYFKSQNSKETQNSISVFYQIGLNSFKKYVYTRIFNMCIGDLFMNKLREENITNVLTDLFLFDNILYYQITVYGATNNITYLDEKISLILEEKEIKFELNKCDDFDKKVLRVITESKKVQFTNLYEVSEKVIESQEHYYSYFHQEDEMVHDNSSITIEIINDYFKKKFQVLPKRIAILNFNYYADENVIQNAINEINGTKYILNKTFEGFVTDNYTLHQIEGVPFDVK